MNELYRQTLRNALLASASAARLLRDANDQRAVAAQRGENPTAIPGNLADLLTPEIVTDALLAADDAGLLRVSEHSGLLPI